MCKFPTNTTRKEKITHFHRLCTKTINKERERERQNKVTENMALTKLKSTGYVTLLTLVLFLNRATEVYSQRVAVNSAGKTHCSSYESVYEVYFLSYSVYTRLFCCGFSDNTIILMPVGGREGGLQRNFSPLLM